jgi:hypothetical protein
MGIENFRRYAAVRIKIEEASVIYDAPSEELIKKHAGEREATWGK